MTYEECQKCSMLVDCLAHGPAIDPMRIPYSRARLRKCYKCGRYELDYYTEIVKIPESDVGECHTTQTFEQQPLCYNRIPAKWRIKKGRGKTKCQICKGDF
jgi:hypothetical protein